MYQSTRWHNMMMGVQQKVAFDPKQRIEEMSKLQEIIRRIAATYPFYGKRANENSSWQNTANWTLHSHPEFVQVKGEGGTPGVWTVKATVDREELVSAVQRINDENNSKEGKTFKCPLCTHATALKRSLKKHMRVRHGKDSVEKPQVKQEPLSTGEFGDNIEPKLEFEEDTDEDAEASGEDEEMFLIRKVGSVEAEVQKDDEMKEEKCPFCSHTSEDKHSLDDHMKEVHKETFKCPFCPHATTFVQNLRKHVKVRHGGKSMKGHEFQEGTDNAESAKDGGEDGETQNKKSIKVEKPDDSNNDEDECEQPPLPFASLIALVLDELGGSAPLQVKLLN